MGEDFAGVVTSDRYGGYDWIQRRQLCWAHLKRDFQSLVDTGGKAEALGLEHLKDLPNLKHLQLADSAMGDEGLGYVGQLIGLEHLQLDGTAITDAGLSSLGKMTHLKSLELRSR